MLTYEVYLVNNSLYVSNPEPIVLKNIEFTCLEYNMLKFIDIYGNVYSYMKDEVVEFWSMK